MVNLQKIVALLCGACLGSATQAAPVFAPGLVNNMSFQAAVNKTGGGSYATGDVLYGVVNVQDISSGTSTWHANNTRAPFDSFTGYFAAQVGSVSATATPMGTFYTVQMTPVTADPNGVFTAGDIANGTALKLYTDVGTAYSASGPVATDIANATDGSLWASLGFGGHGYWTLSVAPSSLPLSGGTGAFDFVQNNTGYMWNKAVDPLDTNCPGGCPMDFSFAATVTNNPVGSSWTYAVSDPARVQPVPLPAAAWLFASGLGGLMMASRRARNDPAA